MYFLDMYELGKKTNERQAKIHDPREIELGRGTQIYFKVIGSILFFKLIMWPKCILGNQFLK